MTALADPPTLERSLSAPSISGLRRALPGAVVIVALLYLTMPFAEATGGRGPWALTKAAVVVVLAVLAAKPWRELRASVLALAAALAMAALVVCLVTPPGWFGATRAAAYGLAAATFLAVAAYARSVRRARLIALVVVAAGVAQFVWSFIPWHGSGDPSAQMVGTFYWHNQFAAFLVVPALIGLALILEHRAPWRAAGWVIVPLAVAGIVHSASRGGMAVLVGGWLLLGVFAFRARRRGVILRWLAAGLVAIGVSIAISGPPFFSSSASAFAAAQARAASGETVAANGHFRLYVWRESISVFEHHPIAGVGYGGFVPAATKVTPVGWPHSPLAHNDYLQPLVEGGLLLALPFMLACGAIGVGLLRVTGRRVRHRVVDVRCGLAVAGLAIMAHAAVDFDWTYPALLSLAAVVGAAAIAPILRRPSVAISRSDAPLSRAGTDSPRLVRVALVGVLLGAVGIGAVAGRVGANALGYNAHFGSAAASVAPGTAAQ